MDDEGGRGERRQDRPHVDPEARFHCRSNMPGLAHMRSTMASWRIDRTDGNTPLRCCAAAPRRAGGAAHFLHAGDLLRRRRVVLTQLGQRRAPAARPGRDPSRPSAAAGHGRERAVEDQRPRSLRSFCRKHDGLWAALAHTEDGRLSEADGVHDGLDLGRSLFKQTNFRDGVRQPDPSLVEQEDPTERGELIEEGLELGHGPEQLDVGDHRPDEDELDRPVAEHLIRQAQIAAGCVRRFRHGLSVLLIPPLAGAPVIVPPDIST